MHLVTGLLVGAAVLFPSSLFAADQEQLSARVAADLKRYYEDSSKQPFLRLPDDPVPPKPIPPPWEAPLKQLAADDAKERQQAAAYLQELLSQALKDQQSGTVRWRATPYWGGGPENPAQQLRQSIANQLAESRLTPAALPVLRWYLDQEPTSQFQRPIMTALAKLDGADADRFRAELAGRPHGNAVVTVEALKQLLARKRTLPAEQLLPLCHHYRRSIREAARQLNQQQGGADPGPFDSARAMRLPAIRNLLNEITPLVVDAPPAKAPLVALTTTTFDKDGKNQHNAITRGWLLSEKGDTVEVLTPFGQRETFKKQLVAAPAADGQGSFTCVLAPVAIKDEVERVEAIRKKDDKDFALSERGGLTGQFQGRGAGIYEIMLAHWLDTAGEPELAARILFPALDTLYTDEHLVLIAREQLGQVLGYQMLVAFVGDRDYARTEKLARLLKEHFPQTRFYAYASALVDQLPRRKDDFGPLKLPSAKEWAALKPTLSREQQIDYLCKRIRLLNCFQWGQPAGISYSQTQYAEPGGMSANASYGGGAGKTEVINPLVELMGPIDGFRPAGKKNVQGLSLTIADVPQLAGYLKDDWFLLTVSFWRDFAPDRQLRGSRELFAWMINHMAKQDVCQAARFEKMTEAEIPKEIQRIGDWARSNSRLFRF